MDPNVVYLVNSNLHCSFFSSSVHLSQLLVLSLIITVFATNTKEKLPLWQRIDISDNAAQQQLTFSSQTELSLVILTRTKHMEDKLPPRLGRAGRGCMHSTELPDIPYEIALCKL